MHYEKARDILIRIFIYYNLDIEDTAVIDKLNIYTEDLECELKYLNEAFKIMRKSFVPKYRGHIPEPAEILHFINIIKREEKPKLLQLEAGQVATKEFRDKWFGEMKKRFKDNIFYKCLEKEVKHV